VDDID